MYIYKLNTTIVIVQKRGRWFSWGLKQTNKQWRGTYTVQTKPLLTACQSCGSPPPWPRPSSPLAVGTKPLLCVPASGSQPGRTLSRFNPGYDWGRSGKLRLGGRTEDWGGGGWALTREWDDGWGVCGNRALTRLSTCEKGQCTANLQCKSAPLQALFGKGASIAGPMQASGDGKCHSHFDSWPPFFPKVSLL